MSLLTRGLGSTAVGLDSSPLIAGQRVPLWGPSSVLTYGLGNRSPLTAHYPYHNTPVAGYYSAPQGESETYAIAVGGQNFTEQITYGKVLRDPNSNPSGAAVETDRLRDFNSGLSATLSSSRPYRNYGTTFQTTPIGVDDQKYTVKPMGYLRTASAGDIEYATMTPESHNPYNARSVVIIFPENAVLGPRAVQRLKLFLAKTKELGVNMRVKKDGSSGQLLIELLDAKTNLKVLQKQVGQFLVKEEVDLRFDMLSYQVYSGME